MIISQPIGIRREFYQLSPDVLCRRFRVDLETDRWLWILQNRKKKKNNNNKNPKSC